MYIAGLDIHDVLRRSPLSHAQGIESIMWLTTLAGVVRAARRARKGALSNHCYAGRHHLPGSVGVTDTETGVAAPNEGKGNIGERPPAPLLFRVLSPLAHGAIVLTPTVYLASVALGRLEQPEWLAAWELPHPGLTQGWFAGVRVLAAIANYSALYYLKRVARAVDAAARIL